MQDKTDFYHKALESFGKCHYRRAVEFARLGLDQSGGDRAGLFEVSAQSLERQCLAVRAMAACDEYMAKFGVRKENVADSVRIACLKSRILNNIQQVDQAYDQLDQWRREHGSVPIRCPFFSLSYGIQPQFCKTFMNYVAY